jgi:SAM-dependent methyltransferase
MKKLTGQDYIDHWKTRMAKGPLEAGTEKNADDTWRFIAGFVERDEPKSILEFGCGYGRMLRRLRNRWPKARLYGVDLSAEALEHMKANWQGRPPMLFNQDSPPMHIRVDLIFTCTVLQHVTDDGTLGRIAEGFRAILRPGGSMVLFENVSHRTGEGGAHMREFAAADYMALWPELKWRECGILVHRLEAHSLMIGRKE